MIAVAVFSCQNDKECGITESGNPNNTGISDIDLIEIPFEEFLLEGDLCQWTNINYDDKVVIIKKKERLI